MNRIIGNKASFALEFSSGDTSNKIGMFYMWINGFRLGSDEETYIKPNFLALSRIKDLSTYSELNVDNKSAIAIFNYIKGSEDLNTATLLGFGESFDDYIIRPFIYNQSVVFLWSVFPNRSKGDTNSLTRVESGVIERDSFDAVLNECEKITGF